MDNIDFVNASLFDNSMRMDLHILKIAEFIQEFFSQRLRAIEENFENRDKALIEVMDSMNMISEDVEYIRKNSASLNSSYNTIEEIEIHANVRSNSSSRINIDTKLANDKPPTGSKVSGNDINVALKTTKAGFISRSPERKSNKFIFAGGSPKNEKKDSINIAKGGDKAIKEILINNPPATKPIIMGKNTDKNIAIDRRGSPNQVKTNASTNFNSNGVPANNVNNHHKIQSTNTISTPTSNKIQAQPTPQVKSRIEVITMGNPTRTGNCSPVNNQSKNNKIQEIQLKEKNSKFKNDLVTRKSTGHEMKSRSPQQRDMNFTKLIGCSPPRKSIDDQNNDTSVNSTEKYLKHERNNLMSGDLSAQRKNSNHSNSCSNHEITKSMNAGNSSILSSFAEITLTPLAIEKFKKLFYRETNILIHLYNFMRTKEKIALKNIGYNMRTRYFESEIFNIQTRIALKKPEENPFYSFSLRKDLEPAIKSESLFLSDYIDDESVLSSLTMMNLVNIIYIVLHGDRADGDTLIDMIEKIEDFIMQIDFDRNIYSKIPTMIKKLKNSIDLFHILRGLYDVNPDNFIFKADLPKKFEALVRFVASIASVVEQGQNIEVVLDLEILNHKIDILRAYSEKQFDH